ncbi:MAG: phosphatidylinositol mannoside acyltransferase [Acidimicrobiia bacterium]
MKNLLQYWSLRLASGVVSLLPAGVARSLGRMAGRIWHAFAGGRRGMAERHMRRVLGEDADVRANAAAVMASYGRYYAEALWVRGGRVPELQRGITTEGLDRIIEARDRGKGMIYALPHIGNWEVAAPVAIAEGVPVVAVAENLPNHRITDWFTKMRGEFGIEIVLATGGTEVMRKLESALAANKAVALLSDRDLRGKGVPVVFFGEETTMPPGPATLALRSGAPLFPVACYFDGRTRYRVVVRPALAVPENGSRSDRIKAMTQELADELESLVRKAPDQWHLVQPNWPSDRE